VYAGGFAMTDVSETTLPPAEWMPSCYMDEVVPPARDSPQAWVVRLSDGAYALDSVGWDDETGTLLRDGEKVMFDWTIIISKREWTGSDWSPTLPPEPDGTSGWMAAPEGEPFLLADAAQFLEPGDVVTPYCWSAKSVRFDFMNGIFVAGEMHNVN
jgi:hypothetical protein